MLRRYLICILIVFFVSPRSAEAILPPDIIFTVGAQFVQLFSIVTLVIGGVIGSIVLVLRTQLLFIRTHIWKIVSIIGLCVAVSIVSAYFVQTFQNKQAYLQEIKNLEAQLKIATAVTSVRSTSSPAYALENTSTDGWETIEDTRKIFNSNTLYLYGDDRGTPFYLEIDLNRRQAPNGLFMHYYYLVGVHQGLDSSDYQQSYSTSTIPIATPTLLSFERKPFSDQSTREEYSGNVKLGDKYISFDLGNVTGDFITRHTQAYTRFQSVGEGSILYNGERTQVYGLAEEIHSNDFSKSIFFEGSENVTAMTRQFVLWDEQGNFYMIDQSLVSSQTPQYVSHTWLLYKDKKTNRTQKGFVSEITAASVGGGPEVNWSITAPDFNNANIKLSLEKYIDDGDAQTRMRALVKGDVQDANGMRKIHGFAFIIE